MSEFSTRARQNLLNKLQKQTRLPGNITGSTPRQIHESVTSNIQSLVNRGEQIRLASQPKPSIFSSIASSIGRGLERGRKTFFGGTEGIELRRELLSKLFPTERKKQIELGTAFTPVGITKI